MKFRILIICGIMLFFNCTLVAAEKAQSTDLSENLKAVVLANFKAYEKEDITRIMDTVHSQSPGFAATKEFSNKIFPLFDLKYELLEFKYIAQDGEFAIAHSKQKTTKISGPEFRDNILESMVIFKQENNSWKFWSQATLSIEYLN